MSTTAGLTLAQFAELPEEPGKQELLKGELIRVPPPKLRHGRIQRRVARILSAYEQEHGEILINTGFRLADDTCLEPDVAFVENKQLERADPDGWIQGAPVLVVEILSPSNTAPQMDDKVRSYLDAGAAVVWVINSRRRRLTAYYGDGRFEVFQATSQEVVEERTVFPGLRFSLSALFEGLN